MPNFIYAAGMSLLGICLVVQPSLAQQIDAPTAPIPSDSNPGKVVAYLGSQPVTLAEVYFHLGRRGGSEDVGSRKLSTNPLPWATLQNTIALIALQRQALQSLRSLKLSASKSEVDHWIETHESSPNQAETALEVAKRIAGDFHIRPEVYLDRVEFRLSWQRYLAKHLTQANIMRHFESQQPRFDGTRFKIWMLSIPVPAGACQQRATAIGQLQELAGSLAKDADVTANDLSRLASDDLLELTSERWIRGMGDLDPQIVDELLPMEAGQQSGIVQTATGVHLLRLLEREPGNFSLERVQPEVRLHMLEFLLRHLASQSQERLPLRAVEGG